LIDLALNHNQHLPNVKEYGIQNMPSASAWNASASSPSASLKTNDWLKKEPLKACRGFLAPSYSESVQVGSVSDPLLFPETRRLMLIPSEAREFRGAGTAREIEEVPAIKVDSSAARMSCADVFSFFLTRLRRLARSGSAWFQTVKQTPYQVVSRAVSSLVLFPAKGEDCMGGLVERPRLRVPINELSSGIVKLKR
jgi:hypothetical protein